MKITIEFYIFELGGDYMILVGRDETLSHFAGIPG